MPAFLLPIAGGYPGDKYRVPNPTSYPSIQQAIAHISSKDELVDHVLNKAEFNHTVSVWRLAADKVSIWEFTVSFSLLVTLNFVSKNCV